MYYFIQYTSKKSFFLNLNAGIACLLNFKIKLEQSKCVLLAYLLLPHTFKALVQCPLNVHITVKGGALLTIEEVPNSLMLSLFGHLAHKGPKYPLSGTYELYHRSNCFCEIGKYSPTTSPFSLEKILRAKEKWNNVTDFSTCQKQSDFSLHVS